ncbi:hypothetical protein FQN57_001758 [Myotisia sp. PD_48]|nr:hypothetical protein FQN57_001758 [Myotisia sp. PD_48]
MSSQQNYPPAMQSTLNTAKQKQPRLLHLPVELQHKIIDVLHQKPYGMSYVEMPYRLWSYYDSIPDMLNLSNTCSWFRGLLAPQRLPSKDPMYPPEVDEVLSNLSWFNELEMLTVEFPACPVQTHGKIWQSTDKGMILTDSEEYNQAWYGLMGPSYRSVLSNSPGYHDGGRLAFTCLNIMNLHPVQVPEFVTENFRGFLSQLKSFRLSIRQWVQRRDYANIAYQCIFGELAENLGCWFFSHLSSVETFHFNPSDLTVVPTYGTSYGLRGVRMPMLRKLVFVNIFICPELIEFLVAHLDTLESIRLEDCVAYHLPPSAHDDSPGLSFPALTWDDLFTTLKTESPTRLRHLQVVDKYTPLGSVYYSGPPVEREVRIFAYGYPGRDGYRESSYEYLQTAWLEGHDLRSYEALKSLVALNRRHDGVES